MCNDPSHQISSSGQLPDVRLREPSISPWGIGGGGGVSTNFRSYAQPEAGSGALDGIYPQMSTDELKDDGLRKEYYQAAIDRMKPKTGLMIAGLTMDALTTGAGIWMNWSAMNKSYDLQNSSLNFQYDLAGRYMALQEKSLGIQQEIMEGKNDLVVELAEIQAEVAKYKIKYETDAKIKITKSAHSFGYINDKFYNRGRPAA